MNYYRCKCKKLESWSSYGPAKCLICKECGTTLGGHPDDHKTEAQPHDWYEEEKTSTYRGVVTREHTRKCLDCGTSEKLP